MRAYVLDCIISTSIRMHGYNKVLKVYNAEEYDLENLLVITLETQVTHTSRKALVSYKTLAV